MSKIRVWITKYALTDGVREVEAEVTNIDDMIIAGFWDYRQDFWGEGKEWHRTLEGAQQKALQMKNAKLDSLARQMDKLAGLQIRLHALEDSK